MEGVHLFFLAFSAVWIIYSDHLGFAYFRGKKQTLPLDRMKLMHRLVWVGLVGLIISGTVMVAPDVRYWMSDTAFLIKMGFVGVLIINGLFIGRLLHTATVTPYRDLSGIQKGLLLLSGAASASGWTGATVIGFFFL